MKGESTTISEDKVVKEGERNLEEETTVMWKQMTEYIRTIARELLGESKRKGHYNKEIWWWTVEVLEVFQKENVTKFGRGLNGKENYEMYKKAEKEIKTVVSDGNLKAYNDLYNKLGTREGEKDIFKLTKIRNRKNRDLDLKCIMSNNQKVLLKVNDLKEMWREYFNKL